MSTLLDYLTPRVKEDADCWIWQLVMTAVRKRHEKWAKWEMLPAERAAIVEALDAHEAITDASSPLQMYEALDVVRRSVMKNMRKAA